LGSPGPRVSIPPSLLLHLLRLLVHAGESLDLSHRERTGDQAEGAINEHQRRCITLGASQMIGGLATSIVVFAVGAVLDFAVTVNPNQHGFNIHTVGIILMIVGAVGAVLSLIAGLSSGMRRHRTVIDDGQGNVVRREDTFI
jgi:hypothetical protein